MSQQRSLLLFTTVIVVLIIGVVSGDGAQNNVTVLRCCPDGHAMDPKLIECKPMNTVWPPYIYSQINQAVTERPGIPSHWNVVASKPPCLYTAFVSGENVMPKFLIFENGSLWAADVKPLLHPSQYCADASVALLCLGENDLDSENIGGDTHPRQKAKIQKCCGQDAAYSEKLGGCIHLTNLTYERFGHLTRNLTDERTTFISGFPTCPSQSGSYIIAGAFDANDSWIDVDGGLHFKKSGVTITSNSYCLEHVSEHPIIRANIFTCPVVGRDGGKADRFDFRFALYPVGLVMSVFFLAATIAVGFVLPSSHQHMLHWRCQTGHVACLLIGDAILAITQFTGDRISGVPCELMAIAMHFFFLAAFFWLNTMCFNIWWTFRDMRPASLDKSQEMFRLRLYQLYAWGGPLIIAGAAAIVDNLPEDSTLSLLRPRFGHQRCWFYGDIEIFTYFYAPIGVLLAINLTLFALTARELTCGLWKREVAKTNVERTALSRVCLKLVVVMGLTWVIDIVSWVVGGPHYLWYFTDLVNALQGVLIFIVVGCQPQIWAAINRLWCFPTNPRRPANNIGHNMSSCSQGLPSMGESTTHANSPQTKCIPTETAC